MTSSRSSKTLPATLAVASLALAASGCASSTGPAAAMDVIHDAKVNDASVQVVDGYAELRLDALTLGALEYAAATDDLAAAKVQASAAINAGFRRGRRSFHDELDRLTADEQRELVGRFDSEDVGDVASLIEDVDAEENARHAKLLEAVESAKSASELREVVRPLVRHATPSIKTAGRVSRAAPWFLFYLPSRLKVEDIVKHEYVGAQEYALDPVIAYAVDADSPAPDAAAVESVDLWAQLIAHAPVIRQESPPQPDYDPRHDRFGRVAALGRDQFRIELSDPTVYAYGRAYRVDGHAFTQLVFTWWFDRQVASKESDPEAGTWDGATLRITLDGDGTPVAFETVDNCGCYHRLYPSAAVEAAAAEQFGQPLDDKHLSVEQDVGGKIDLMVPKAVEVGEGPAVVRARSGWHGIIDVDADGDPPADVIADTRSYTLRPYRDLEHLPLPGGGFTSMFYENGLAKGGQRGEGIYFTPIGILSAGQPRQRGTQLIQWDQYDFDDPYLLTRYLRWPEPEAK